MSSSMASSAAFPLHGLYYLLGLRPVLVELGSRAAKVDDHRLALRILKDGESVLVSLLYSPVADAEDRELHAVKAACPGVVLWQIPYDHVDLLAFDSSYRDRLGFIGLQVGVLLEPADQVLGRGCCLAGHIYQFAGLVDLIDVKELEQRLLSRGEEAHVIVSRRTFERPALAHGERQGRLERFGTVFPRAQVLGGVRKRTRLG